jgi:hypothetical protein
MEALDNMAGFCITATMARISESFGLYELYSINWPAASTTFLISKSMAAERNSKQIIAPRMRL